VPAWRGAGALGGAPWRASSSRICSSIARLRASPSGALEVAFQMLHHLPLGLAHEA